MCGTCNLGEGTNCQAARTAISAGDVASTELVLSISFALLTASRIIASYEKRDACSVYRLYPSSIVGRLMVPPRAADESDAPSEARRRGRHACELSRDVNLAKSNRPGDRGFDGVPCYTRRVRHRNLYRISNALCIAKRCERSMSSI
ncbi:hypothetical protein PUN28_010040 [Cardiocondyla obscurior]|uniref:DUF1540 domain-containing protein n=1 Tax=Cardiocondyla obscurior TaxID=286306 RepID=A0AAW2FQ97_9HYME